MFMALDHRITREVECVVEVGVFFYEEDGVAGG